MSDIPQHVYCEMTRHLDAGLVAKRDEMSSRWVFDMGSVWEGVLCGMNGYLVCADVINI